MKTKGLVHVYTGDGKGKTTAAFGVALRTLGLGGRVAVVQFFKGATLNGQRSPEKQSLRVARCALSSQVVASEVKVLKKISGKFQSWSFGVGFTWQVPREENQKAVNKAWKQCCKLLRDPKYSLVIFDEINIALKYKFLRTPEVLQVLKKRPAAKHVILTGRGAPQALVRFADLVTEMKCLKHPFRKGVLAKPGIDY
ncbi:MAG TPA: cob(I)yrinic acid a,c-diamide adenosyltransferase [Candidatus Omnitrophota bacterium]|nr:cob(I)yrinic acid a,c-diamide adenosyltransferase [Candidatus Omnitrophota bacterium]HPS37559.1 cob(I)yrinic acid a,c-diamide adenosyltransferase [Candidatus Omnitrophota bacterium]